MATTTSNGDVVENSTKDNDHEPRASSATAEFDSESQRSGNHTQSGSASSSRIRRSKTRPTFLPPKSGEEDKKHMADWEKMMMQSRAAGIVILF